MACTMPLATMESKSQTTGSRKSPVIRLNTAKWAPAR